MKTALYLRVSTGHQNSDLQVDELRGYAARAGLDVVGEYIDMAVSGRKEERPQLQMLLRAARNLIYGVRQLAHRLNGLFLESLYAVRHYDDRSHFFDPGMTSVFQRTGFSPVVRGSLPAISP